MKDMREMFITEIEEPDDIAPPDDIDLTAAIAVYENDPQVDAPAAPASRQYFRWTDLGNAERFASDHAGHAMWTEALGWLIYNGRCFERDTTQQVVQLASRTIRSMYVEASKMDDAEKRMKLIDFAKSCESNTRINAMLSLARSRLAVRVDDLDADPWLLNVRNGTFDFRTGQLRPHSPTDRITKLADVIYDPAATAPQWEAFLRQTFNGNDDLIRFAARAIGYAATGMIREHCLNILYGVGGNGKGVFVRTVNCTLGDYATTAAPRLLMAKKYDAHPTERADLFGRRFVECSESQEGGRFDEETVKMLTGGDRIKGRLMGRDFFEFPPTHKLFLATNHRPRVRGTDVGIWRRMLLWPFTVVIPSEDQDTALGDKLATETSGVLNWIIAGCRDWQANGLAPPACVRAAVEEYRKEQDTLGDWLSDCCLTGDLVGSTAVSVLSTSYRKWCEAGGHFPLNATAFGLALGERGYEKVEDARPVRRDGIVLRMEPAHSSHSFHS